MPKRKPLKGAEELEIPGIEVPEVKKKRIVNRRPACPYCEAEWKAGDRRGTAVQRVRLDGFGRPLGECEQHLHDKVHGRLA